jgi:pteridine reductase
MLRGRRALVTGAGTRVGQAIAVALGSQGMQVAVHYHENREGAQETMRQIAAAGGTAVAVNADLSSSEAARQLVSTTTELLQGLDLLVPSAANFEATTWNAISEADFRRTLDLDLLAPFTLAQCAAPELAKSRGSIVFITCSSVVVPFRGYIPYVVAKAGVYQLMRALALELAPHVRVNAVAPGFVLPPDEMPPEQVERLRKQIPLQRVGGADEVASAVVFLAMSRFITGEQIVIDGGRALAKMAEAGGA